MKWVPKRAIRRAGSLDPGVLEGFFLAKAVVRVPRETRTVEPADWNSRRNPDAFDNQGRLPRER